MSCCPEAAHGGDQPRACWHWPATILAPHALDTGWVGGNAVDREQGGSDGLVEVEVPDRARKLLKGED